MGWSIVAVLRTTADGCSGDTPSTAQHPHGGAEITEPDSGGLLDHPTWSVPPDSLGWSRYRPPCTTDIAVTLSRQQLPYITGTDSQLPTDMSTAAGF